MSAKKKEPPSPEALGALCDLASAAIGKHYVKGASWEVSQVHSEIIGAIRALGSGELSETEASRKARALGQKLRKVSIR